MREVSLPDAHLPESTKLMLQEDHGKWPLEEWQLAFCQWLAAHPRSRFKEQIQVASEFAGTLIPMVEIRRIRAQKNFMAWYGRYRRKIEQRLDDAREAFETTNIPKAIEAHAKALDQAVAEGDYRAIPPLVEPAIKAMYKHLEGSGEKPTIIVNLGGFAEAHLNDPVEDVEYEQLPNEIEASDEAL